MNLKLHSLLSTVVFTLGNGIFCILPSLAQVTTDGTTSTTVTPNDKGVQIENGDRSGGNLFHSFEEFSVPTNREAFFNNADDIANIFSRVTGGNISNIDGTLRANGTANLFLINPAGIVFGENARLQLGGSFYGSTADSIIFPDGEFNATDLENPPLITVNAPIGLGFRDNPAEIVNQSTADDLGLQLASENTFALVGGDIRFTGGLVNAPGANIELGGLTEAGIVTINEDGSLSFSDELARANIVLDDASSVNAISDGGGSIAINASNFEILNGSKLLAGILEGTESPEAQAGDIIANVTEKITIDSQDSDLETSIQNVAGNVSDELATDLFTKGSPGNISLNTKILEGNGNFSIVSANNGEGNVGNVNITATESISLRGQAEFFPGFGSAVGFSGIGDGGDVIVTTPSLTIFDANILSSTLGKGNAGNIIINVADSLTIDGESQLQAISIGGGNSGNIFINGENADISLTGEDLIITTTVISSETQFALFPELVELLESLGFSSTLGSQGGDIIINARNLSAGNDVQIATSTLAKASSERLANAGDIEINVAENFSLKNSSQLFSDTAGQGNAGNISLNVGNAISLDETSFISTGIQQKLGDLAADFTQSIRGGDISITSNSLSITEGSLINASTLDRGNAGNIAIDTKENIVISSTESDVSLIFNGVGDGAVGNGGEIKIATKNFTINGSGGVTASTLGEGNTGSISLVIEEDITLNGEMSERSGIVNLVGDTAIGNGDEISIAANNLTIINGATIDSSTQGNGSAGNIFIDVGDNISLVNQSVINTGIFQILGNSPADSTQSIRGGDITISSNSLSLTESSGINASTLGRGNAGNIAISTQESILIDGTDSIFSGIFNGVNDGAIGNGGEIKIATKNFTINGSGGVTASTLGKGNTGSISLIVEENITLNGGVSERSGIVNLVGNDAMGNGDEISVTANNISLTNGATIDASTRGTGNAGNIFITANENLSLDGRAVNIEQVSSIVSLVDFNAVGNGGEIQITTNNLSTTAGALISATTVGRGDVGKISITANENIVIDGQTADGTSLLTGISNDIGAGAVGNSNSITIVTDEISVSNRGFISTSTLGEGNGGNIDLVANTFNIDRGGLFAINRSLPLTTNESRTGGNINLEVSEDIVLRNNSFISAQAGENASGGNINIDTNFIVAFPSSFDGSDIRADAEQGKGGNIKITAESVLGIAERTLNPLTNDLNASSQVAGLAGTISIDTPDINPLRTKPELPNNPIPSNIVATNVCNVSIARESSSLIVKGKGGLIPQIIHPLTTDNLIIDEQTITFNPLQSSTITRIPTDLKPAIATAKSGKLYAARGMVRQEDGTIYLTAYPTSRNQRAIANNSEGCGYK